MVNGIKLALDQADNKAGQWTVNYTSLDDSTARRASGIRARPRANARKAASDPKAVYYIGEFNSGRERGLDPDPQQGRDPAGEPREHVRRPDDQRARQRAGRAAEVLPDREPHLPADRPERLDPGGRRPDGDEAGRLHEGRRGQRQGGVRRRPGGAARAGEGHFGVNIASNTGIDPTAPNFRSYASPIKGQGADCFFFAGIVSNGAVQITKDVNAALPNAKIFGGDGVCTDSYTSAKEGGVPAASLR